MRHCRFVFLRHFAFIACGWASLALSGCSQEEHLEADPGVSPFSPPPANSKSISGKPGKRAKPAGAPLVTATQSNDTKPKSTVESAEIDARFGTNEVERQLRVALRTAQKGDPVEGAVLLDKILAIEPIHREALLARAMVAIKLANSAKSVEDRAANIEKAVALSRALIRAYDALKPHEMEVAKRSFHAKVKVLAEQGRIDEATKILDETNEMGFDPFARVESDPTMASFRSSPAYQSALKADEHRTLADARARTNGVPVPPQILPFRFTLSDLEGKKVSLADFKGKVVVVDFWGTWCAPCREAIPGLIALYNRRRAQGLEILGLSYEKEAESESQAREMVKRFVKAGRIPYPCLMGEPDVLSQIPGFEGFPTTLIVDRAGRVRALVTQNTKNSLNFVTDVVRVLLAEPLPKPEAAAKKP